MAYGNGIICGLKQSQTFWSSLISNFPSPILVVKPDTSIEYVNPVLEKTVGFSLAELTGRQAPYPWWAEGTLYQTKEEYEKAMRRGAGTNEELFKNRSGETFWVETLSVPLINDGKVNYYMSFWVDVTMRKQAERNLQESEDRFHRLSEAAFEGIVIHENLKILEVNNIYAQMHGYEISELIGMNLLELVAPEGRDLTIRNMSSGNEGRFEQVHLKKDGSRFLVEVAGRNVQYKGRPMRVGAARDINERVHIENMLRVIFESIVDGIIICDMDGFIVHMNNAAIQLHGYSCKEEVIGQGLFTLIARKDHARAKRDRHRMIHHGSKQKAEYTCLRKDGTEFDAELSIALLRDGPENPTGFVAVGRDITLRKQLRQNILFYASQVTKAQEEERRRLARELHDETIQSLASLALDLEEVLRNRAESSSATIRQIRCILDKTRSIMKEVQRLSHELRPEVLDQLGLVAAVEILANELDREGVIKSSVVTIGSERRLSAELELALFRIAQEALNNVRRHSQARAVVIKLEFATDKVRLLITDDGKGFEMPAAKFDLASSSRLGLIGMRERAHLFGGEFSIESERGKGTTVTIEMKNVGV